MSRRRRRCCRRRCLPARPLLWLLPPAAAAQRATLQDKKAILDKVDCFIFDCDGALLSSAAARIWCP